MELRLIVAIMILVVVLVLWVGIQYRRNATPRRRPVGSMEQAVRPHERERMQAGVEYCRVSFMGDWGKTEVTYYGNGQPRQESFADTTGFGARDFGRKLERNGWTLTAEISHKEGHEAYFERRKP